MQQQEGGMLENRNPYLSLVNILRSGFAETVSLLLVF
jgi:hypothetical protein